MQMCGIEIKQETIQKDIAKQLKLKQDGVEGGKDKRVGGERWEVRVSGLSGVKR